MTHAGGDRGWTRAAIGLLVGCVVGGAVGHAIGVRQGRAGSGEQAPTGGAPAASAASSATAAGDDLTAQLAAGPCKGSLICDLAIAIPSPPAVEGVTLAVEGAKITGSPPYRVSFSGRARVDGDLGLDELAVAVVLLGADGKTVGEGEVDFHSAYEPRLLRGDSGTVFSSVVVTAPPTAIVWKDVRRRVVAAPPLPEGQVAALDGAPEGVQLEARVRERSYESLRVEGLLVVTNRSTRTLSDLVIEVKSATMKRKSALAEIAREGHPPLLPGERRVVRYRWFDAEEDGGRDLFAVKTVR
jgi:hypothetical protein